ncbi:MAG TPA: molybdate ABC transporter substrate-binding protein [Xanthobacteraceae bacterium]|nr:molybdate ABC transporter substrate-binding protein [Xanthobacteraceae bacterium]
MKIGALAATAKVAFLFLLAQGLAAEAADVQLFSGGGFRSVVTELAPAFERATGHKVVATFDSTGGFERRIKAGESFDVVLIGPEVVDSLIKEGKVVSGTNANVARGGLGVAVKAGNPKPDIGSVDAFKRALLNAKSVAYVGEGHSGQYFLAMLGRLGIAEQMKPKLKPQVVADVLKAGASGEADLVVYIVPAILADRSVELVGPFPAEIQSYVVLATGLSANAKEPEAAKSLIRFLGSEAAAPVIKARGW